MAQFDDLGLKSALDSVTTPMRTVEAFEKSENQDEEAKRREGWRKWLDISRQLGERYAECKLGNFEFSEEAPVKNQQESIVGKLERYCEEMPQMIEAGRSILLYGPAGTGKDHLLSALLRVACRNNLTVVWRNGMDLYADRRDAISRDTPERDLIRELSAPDVLAISDPVPPWGSLTEGQAEFLFRIFDARYRRKKSIWVTANFTDRNEAESRIGVQVVDRLRHGCLALHCNWPSYRRPLN